MKRNLYLCCLFHALQMSLFPVAIITLFWKHEIGLSMTEIMLLQGYFGLCIAIFEFPSGYFADRFGYRKTLLLASVMVMVGWTLYSLSASVAAIIVAETVLALGMSLISGTDQALMFESLKDLQQEKDFTKWHGRLVFFGQIGEGTAALVAGVLYVWAVRLPFVAEVFVWALNLFVAYALVEPLREKAIAKPHWEQIKEIGGYLFVRHPHLRKIMLFAILLGLASFIPVWIVQLHAQSSGMPTQWLGPLWAAANYMVALGAIVSAVSKRKWGTVPTLALCIGLVLFGFLGMGHVFSWWGALFYLLITFMRGLNGPILAHLMHDLVTSENRAAMMSVKSLVFRLSFFVVGPIIGWIIDGWGSHSALVGLGWSFFVLLSLGLFDLHRKAKPYLHPH